MIWGLLVVLGGVYLVVRTWGLWGQTKELSSELATAQRRLDEVQGQLDLLGERIGSAEDLAVFASPVAARKQRAGAKAAGLKARRLRRSTTRPAWAKHVD
jgi:hypothetical protein